VLATHIDPWLLQTVSFPNLEVCRHDIAKEPLPTREFDLVHARVNLPERGRTLERMMAVLKAGGSIVIEEYDDLLLLHDPVVNLGELSPRARSALEQTLNGHTHFQYLDLVNYLQGRTQQSGPPANRPRFEATLLAC
jgi:hypothetical protein